MHHAFHTLHTTDVMIGFFLGLLSCIFAESGNMLLKKYSAKKLSNSKSPCCNAFLACYTICILCSIGCGFLSLKFLSLSISNCGNALNVILVSLMSWFFLNEKINRYQVFCIILLSGATVGVALTGDRTKPKNMMQTLGNNMTVSYYPVVFLSIVGVLELVGAVFLWKRYTMIAELNKAAELRRNSQLLPSSTEAGTSESTLTSNVYYAKVITKIPGETYIERVLAIFWFSCLCAMQLFWMLISADILLNQITRFFKGEPVVMIGWVFFPVGVFCAGVFFCFMQMNLACFRAIDVLPIYVAFQNITNGIGSIAMVGSTPDQGFSYTFCLACAFVFGLLYTALIDEKQFFAHFNLCCFKKSKTPIAVIESIVSVVSGESPGLKEVNYFIADQITNL